MGLLADDFALIVDALCERGADVVDVAETVAVMSGLCDAFDARVPGIYTVVVCPRRHYHLTAAEPYETGEP